MKKSNRNYDFTKIIKPEHAGKWVALNTEQTKVIGYSDTYKALRDEVGKDGVVFMKAQREGVSYAY
ncbi:MAG: DUF5678 domain-containing protein [bacterium]|nr:DUF5678 domain-containing protein [bacterium]